MPMKLKIAIWMVCQPGADAERLRQPGRRKLPGCASFTWLDAVFLPAGQAHAALTRRPG
jgi:hypothetical protein